MKSAIALVSLAFGLGVSASKYSFFNHCPDAVRLRNYKSDHSVEIKPGEFAQSDAHGVYYINPDDEGNYQDALQVVFGVREDGSSFYYAVKPDNKRPHVGILILPLDKFVTLKEGQCSYITCDSIDCEGAFDKQKDVNVKSPLLHNCNQKKYGMEFCPRGKYADDPESDETHL